MTGLDRADYVNRVLGLFRSIPETRRRTRAPDRALAGRLHDRGVPLDTVAAAMILALARRRFRPPDAPTLMPIASLHYFLPVIEELLSNPPDPNYLDHLRARLGLQDPSDHHRARSVHHQEA
jgi:hypothetical protein